MKLSLFSIVTRAIEVRAQLRLQIEAIKRDEFCISIAGERQDDAIRAIVRPVLEREIGARMASIDKDLESYGVDVNR